MIANNPYNSALFKNYDEEFPPLNQALTQPTIPSTKSKAQRANITHCHAILIRTDLHQQSLKTVNGTLILKNPQYL